MNIKILLGLLLYFCFTASVSTSKSDDSERRFRRQYDDSDEHTNQDADIPYPETTEPTTTDVVAAQTSTEVEELTTDVTNDDIETSTSVQLVIDNPATLLIYVLPTFLYVRRGETVEVNCQVFGATSKTTVFWRQLTPERRLALADDPSKIGVYQCIAYDGASFFSSANVTMRETSGYISQADDLDTATVQLTSNSNHRYLHIIAPHMEEGDYVEIQCQGAAPHDQDRIQWYFNNSRIFQDQGPLFPRGKFLYIRPITRSYLGHYRCTIPKSNYTDGNSMFTFEDADPNKFLSSSCTCCSSSHCRNQSSRCSTNIDCECLTMTMTGSSICADTIISCKKLHLCEKDNMTCSTPNTVCINNTRCNVPVCYPIERASINLCPPLTSRTSIISKNISTVICFPECSNGQTCVKGICVDTENLVISATWSRAGDGDLVVTTPNDKSIHFQNRNATTATDQGTLNFDDTTSAGPEIVFWVKENEPPHGTYHICFEQYGLHATIEDPITATIVVRSRFGVFETYTKTFTTRTEPLQYTCAPNMNTYIASFTYP
ncbi:hypothetical protein I4U23_011475 [Adineta vaga]|nr:hypothetical protein I4U23_011475 [Adineta vaga]